jgi:uncharacterized protein
VASAERLRWVVVAAGLTLAAHGGGAVPPPLPQSGADCKQPTYASDRLVCGDSALLALDRQVGESWRAIAATHPATQTALELPRRLEAQEAWFGRRSRCAFVEAQAACLEAAYRDRARVLDAWQRAASGALPGPGTRLRCTGAPWGDATVTVHRPTADALVLGSLDGRVLAIATPGGGQDGWRPFVQFEGAATPILLRPLSAAVISCGPE